MDSALFETKCYTATLTLTAEGSIDIAQLRMTSACINRLIGVRRTDYQCNLIFGICRQMFKWLIFLLQVTH